MGYPRWEAGVLILGPWAERERFWGGGGPGPCPPSDKVRRPLPLRLRVGPYSWGLRLGGRAQSRPPLAVGERVRRSMKGSDRRLFVAASYLEVAGARPSHLLTLTIPASTWSVIPKEIRPGVFARARHEFFRRLAQHVRRRLHVPLAFLRWDEFTKAGVPHVHALLDLGGRLPQKDWEHLAREWVPEAWRRALRGAGLPIRRAPRTRLEALRHPDMRYAKSYAVKSSGSGGKAHQHRLPYPGRWGRSWDVGGPWRVLLREMRQEDHLGPEVVRLQGDALDLLVLQEALSELGAPVSLLSDFLPAVQVAAGPEPGTGEVLRRRLGRFWRSPSHREALFSALSLAGLLPPPFPSSASSSVVVPP